MKFKNTAPGGRGGWPVNGQPFEVAAGGVFEIDAATLKGIMVDPVHKGWFTDGTFVEVGTAAAAVVAAGEADQGGDEAKARPKK